MTKVRVFAVHRADGTITPYYIEWPDGTRTAVKVLGSSVKYGKGRLEKIDYHIRSDGRGYYLHMDEEYRFTVEGDGR